MISSAALLATVLFGIYIVDRITCEITCEHVYVVSVCVDILRTCLCASVSGGEWCGYF